MSHSEPEIRVAAPEDLPAVMAGLAALASDLDDPFEVSTATLSDALYGSHAHSFGLVSGAETAPLGVVLCSPFISTTLGHPCLYVSDLWVAKQSRRQALGRRLLEAAAREAASRWQCKAMFLHVYSDSVQAMAFYRHLGFEIRSQDQRVVLQGYALQALIKEKPEQ